MVPSLLLLEHHAVQFPRLVVGLGRRALALDGCDLGSKDGSLPRSS